ncbi:MAG: trypsin-like serine protease [Gemmatimonas sp.]
MHNAVGSFVTRITVAKRATRALALAAISSLTIVGRAVAQDASQSASQSPSTFDQMYGSKDELFANWVARSTLVVAGDDFNAALYSTPRGYGYEGVAALYVQRTDGNFICTGALLEGSLSILTAAHCLTNTQGVNITNSVTAVFFPSGSPAVAQELVLSSSTHVNPLYTGETIDAHDVAIVKLASSPSLSVLNSAYSLYLGDPFGSVQSVGSGATGTGNSGIVQDGGFTNDDRRTGFNNVDFTWTDPEFEGYFINRFGTADPTTLVADFDHGTVDNNSGCLITGWVFTFTQPRCGAGFGNWEVNLGPGDSGGPLFVGNQIAGIASYALTFGSGLGDTDDELNGTFGEFSGWTSTAYNQQWIMQVTAVPEPGSMVLVGAGLVAVAGVLRRRNKIS